MITFVQGSLFDSPAQVITNTVNCVGVMGKGVAREFKRRLPAMFEDYRAKCAAGAVRLGEPYLWEDDATQVLNFPTKDHWRGRSKLEYIEAGLRYLAENHASLGIHSLAMPPLGCGNGGLEWHDVKQLMVRYLEPLPDLEVYVYEPPGAATVRADGTEHADAVHSTAASAKPAALPGARSI